MKSATLHFERGIFAKSVLRFWPIWAVYAFIWMLVLPVSIIDTLTRWTATDANSLVLNSIPNTAVMLCPAAFASASTRASVAPLFRALGRLLRRPAC